MNHARKLLFRGSFLYSILDTRAKKIFCSFLHVLSPDTLYYSLVQISDFYERLFGFRIQHSTSNFPYCQGSRSSGFNNRNRPVLLESEGISVLENGSTKVRSSTEGCVVPAKKVLQTTMYSGGLVDHQSLSRQQEQAF